MQAVEAMGIVPQIGHFLFHWYIVGPIIIALLAVVFIRERKLRNPEIRGHALTGTARVLSVEQSGGNETSLALRIGLRVEIPGHHPYDVSVQRSVKVIHVPRVQPGATLPVQVDAANPQIVRIDFSQPIG
jgi:hypothetical protein